MGIGSFFKRSTEDLHSDRDLARWVETLRRKWTEVPAGINTRLRTPDLLDLSDQELLWTHEVATRELTEGEGFSIKGWYHCLYKDVFRGKSVLDVGCGLGFDGIVFAKAGAFVTFADIAETNLRLVRRLCQIREISNADFFYIESLDSLSALPGDFDVIWCMGSLINAPFEVVRVEAQELLKHLKPEGRWIELAYPRARWKREGQMPFDQWGDKTDGGAPWMEWYDLRKITARLAPAEFDVVLHFDFHNNDFNWFDLIRKG